MRGISLAILAFAVSLLATHNSAQASDQVSVRAKPKYTITVQAGKNGKVSPSKRSTVVSGTSKTYVITPSKGFLIDALAVNGAPQAKLPSKRGAPFTLTLKKISENLTINASFAKTRTVQSLSVGTQVSVVDAKK